MRKKIFLNMSTVGTRVTGLGVYSRVCGEIIARRFDAITLTSTFDPLQGQVRASPSLISLGAGKLGAIFRVFYLATVQVPKDMLAYSPTHHGLLRAKTQVITIHDLIALHHPRQHPFQWLLFRFFLPYTVKRCAAVFTVSRVSAHDLIRTYKLEPGKVFVVPNCIQPRSVEVKAVQRSQFLLCVGARFNHKNVHELLENHAVWRDRYTVTVVSSSGKYRRFLENKVLEFNLCDRVTFLDFVSQDKLDELYRTCAALVYPSKWEGFGIPPLEALSWGAPVIASDIPVHREVCESAAIFVELGNRNSWRAAFDSLQNKNSAKLRCLNAESVLLKYSKENTEQALVAAINAVSLNSATLLHK